MQNVSAAAFSPSKSFTRGALKAKFMEALWSRVLHAWHTAEYLNGVWEVLFAETTAAGPG
jgi:hypothetical protein